MSRATRAVHDDERRARAAHRHALLRDARVTSPVDAAERVVALHATDPATVHLAALARMTGGQVGDVEDALYQKRTLVRLLGMRRSMFVVSREVAPVVQAACSRSIAAAQRRRLVKLLADCGAVPGDAAAWLADVEESVLAALRSRGTATAVELVQDEPRLRTSLTMAAGKPYEAAQNITSRVLFLLGCDARIVRGRPRGSWVSSQYVWSPWETWIPGGLPELEAGPAQAELVRRWLAACGPAPLPDVQWWTGLGKRDVQAALAANRAVEVRLDSGETGLVLPEDVDPPPPTPPWAALLPGLDPTAMAWHARDWYLGRHAAQVTDRTGNIGPTVWWQGRIVGGWAQRPSGEVVHRLLEDIGRDGAAEVETAVADLTDRLGGVVVTPRFPAPLDRELRG